MSFSMSARPSLHFLAVFATASALSLSAFADPEAAGPSRAPAEALGNPQSGHFGNTDEGYFGNPDSGNFHNSQFPTVPPPQAGSTTGAASPASKLSEGGGSPYVKLDAPPAEAKGREISTADAKPETKHKGSHKPKKMAPPET